MAHSGSRRAETVPAISVSPGFRRPWDRMAHVSRDRCDADVDGIMEIGKGLFALRTECQSKYALTFAHGNPLGSRILKQISHLIGCFIKVRCNAYASAKPPRMAAGLL